MTQLPHTISKARARLLVRAPFFGSIALGLAWVNAPTIATMATDGRHLWFNPDWCDAQGVEKTMGVIAHEVLHVVNKHHLRRGDRDLALWNVAADLLINRLLQEDTYVLPPTLLFDPDKRYAGLPVETIYARLLEQQAGQPSRSGNPSSQTGTSGTDDGQPDGSQTPGSQLDDANAGHDRSNPNGQEGGIVPARHWGEVRELTTEHGKPLSPSERRRAEHDLDVRIRQAAAAAKRAGKFATSLSEIVEAATDRVDWRDTFRMIFDGTLRGEVSWARPNRRFIQRGLYLPAWRRTGAGRIAFVLDTSGSIPAAELSVYTSAVLGILAETAPEQVALIQCDTKVRHVAYLQPGESVTQIEVVGRGGTYFQPAFDWIADTDYRPNAIVYATDLISSDTPRDPGCPTIWLTPTRGRSVPFGDIVAVSL
jgi:predicted metal-dependent peptidase